MSKKSKNIILKVTLFVLIILANNLFYNPNLLNASNGETPIIYDVIVAWGPSILIIILYFVFLKLMRELIDKVERIAVALEKKDGPAI